MKKFFEIVGLITLMAFSFIYTEKTSSVIKELDSLMIEIKENMNSHRLEAKDAFIDGDTIIPGKNGYEVNINESYQNMKNIGKYSSNLLQYDTLKPNISINNIYDKYIISGNKDNNAVALVFKVNDNINNIVKILSDNNVDATFFVDDKWFNQNNDIIDNLMKKYILGYMGEYNNNFIWINTIFSKIGKQDINFCYTENNNSDILLNCSLQKNYTIKPSIIVKDSPISEIKKSIKSGSIISLPMNSKVLQELPLIIKYIKSRDLRIVNLIELIKE